MDLATRIISTNYTSERGYYNDKYQRCKKKSNNLGLDENKHECLTLEEFCVELPNLIRSSKKEENNKERNVKVQNNRIGKLMSSLVLEEDEWERFAFYDPCKKYTRNLVATDNKTYTLMLLCWSTGRESPIHNHPCDGCWFRVCKGEVKEMRYKKDPVNNSLNCFYNENYKKGEQSYIEDSMGLHKVCNPSFTEPAVTLHLYCPPFQKCKIWTDPCKASNCSISCACLYSEYGARIKD